MFLNLLKINFKRSLRSLPALFAGGFFLALLIWSCVAAASAVLYRSEPLIKASVAVVPGDISSRYMDMAIDYISNMSSTSMVLEFEVMDAEDADRALKQGDVIAEMIFPEGMVEGILYGENIPAIIRISESDNLSALFLSELINDGVTLLSSAQAASYTAATVYYSIDAEEYLSDAYDHIDLINFAHVAEREKVFDITMLIPGSDEGLKVSDDSEDSGISGARSVALYYISSGFILFALFWGSCMTGLLKYPSSSFISCLFAKGITAGKYTLAQFITAASVFFFILAPVGCIAGVMLLEDISLSALLIYILLLSFFVSAFSVFLHVITKSPSLAVLLQFVLSTAMLLLSGGIIPSAFLPKLIAGFGKLLPAAFLQNSLLGIFLNINTSPDLRILIWTLVLLIITYAVLKIRHIRGTL
ncbi:MAG: ABC transporter permease [Lachnospiraceae bacterium]|nr:ABC transporter permease [Lachnospiraceae bacterium]